MMVEGSFLTLLLNVSGFSNYRISYKDKMENSVENICESLRRFATFNK